MADPIRATLPALSLAHRLVPRLDEPVLDVQCGGPTEEAAAGFPAWRGDAESHGRTRLSPEVRLVRLVAAEEIDPSITTIDGLLEQGDGDEVSRFQFQAFWIDAGLVCEVEAVAAEIVFGGGRLAVDFEPMQCALPSFGKTGGDVAMEGGEARRGEAPFLPQEGSSPFVQVDQHGEDSRQLV